MLRTYERRKRDYTNKTICKIQNVSSLTDHSSNAQKTAQIKTYEALKEKSAKVDTLQHSTKSTTKRNKTNTAFSASVTPFITQLEFQRMNLSGSRTHKITDDQLKYVLTGPNEPNIEKFQRRLCRLTKMEQKMAQAFLEYGIHYEYVWPVGIETQYHTVLRKKWNSMKLEQAARNLKGRNKKHDNLEYSNGLQSEIK